MARRKAAGRPTPLLGAALGVLSASATLTGWAVLAMLSEEPTAPPPTPRPTPHQRPVVPPLPTVIPPPLAVGATGPSDAGLSLEPIPTVGSAAVVVPAPAAPAAPPVARTRSSR